MGDPTPPPRTGVTQPALEDVMRVDRFRLRRSRKRLSEAQYQDKIAKSAALLANRRAAAPRIEYPVELPICSHRDELVDLIRRHQVIVVCGETGSGKSTQLPKLCLDAGLGREAMIGHTQPRRLAARSIATRLGSELGTPLGKWVGYQVRFGDQTSEESLIKLMTDGILLAETQSDRFLDAYNAIIIDEAHERSLNIDFLLGYLRRLQGKRADLKIIITSATIDAERFATHFAGEEGPAPIVNVEGRGYPVEMRYLPWEDVVEDVQRGYDLSQHVIAGIEAAGRANSGDTLVFLPTERDIREVSHRVSGHYKRLGLDGRVDLLPLYARLPQAEQQRIFNPAGENRRIIFATNVAESSLTVPGIRSVVDAGTARISRYSARSKIQRLPIETISRASADQRAGRCGRIGPGVCVRLYSEDDYDSRDAFTTPEIRRTNLASVVLQTKTLRLGKLEEFPLLDPPRTESIREGIRTLIELGAIDERHELTKIGWKLGRMPVDPRVGRIILAADEHGVLPEILPIAAAIEIQDPRDRPPDKQQSADQAHAEFQDSQSDFLSYLRLWRHYEQLRGELSRNRLSRALRKQFLSPTRMREWADVYRQLREMAATSLRDAGGPDANQVKGSSHGRRMDQRVRIGKIRYQGSSDSIVDKDRYAAIHQSLLSGLLSSVATVGDRNEYNGASGLKLFLWPGSGVFAAKPKWIVAAELVETAKQYARTVARIDPRWIEQVGGHLLKRSHRDPHWSGKSNGAFCYEQATLFGLPVYARRRVPLPPIDPDAARQLLIEHGLAGGELKSNARFLQHNRALLESIASIAAKTRRRDLVVDTYALVRFYQGRLPADVFDRARLEKIDRDQLKPGWVDRLKNADGVSNWLQAPPPTAVSESLFMNPGDVLDIETEIGSQQEFPDHLSIGQTSLPLNYRFEPGSDRDGVNVTIHQSVLSQISDDRLGWLVPGLLETKLIAMIKSLPKRIRRNLVPAADYAAKIALELKADFGSTPFMKAACEAMSRHAQMTIGPGDFDLQKLDRSHEFLVTVVDDEGETVTQGRGVEAVQHATSPTATTPVKEVLEEDWARERATTFDIDHLPTQVIRTRGGVQVALYPGLVDQGDSVGTDLFPRSGDRGCIDRTGHRSTLCHRREKGIT